MTKRRRCMPGVMGWFSVACMLVVMTPRAYAVEQVNSALLGGKGTVRVAGDNAFSLPSANLSPSRRLDFSVGNSFFRNPWVIAPSSTDARDGLGPLFNTNACQNCHIKDGRGHPPAAEAMNAVSMLVRLSIPAMTEADRALAKVHGFVPLPVYGGQLQDMAVPGVPAEARVRLQWQSHTVTLSDGVMVSLRRPQLQVTDLAYGPLPDNVLTSVRIAPPMIGLGLLEAISEADVLGRADPDDRNNDGISGRPNQVWDARHQKTVMGRFGWKAGQPNLDQQNAAAFAGDMGLTTALIPADDCTQAQKACRAAVHGGVPEVSDALRAMVLFYTRHLAVPVQRGNDKVEVQRGRQLFEQVGCAACHVPSQVTAATAAEPELSGQTIWPYTDLLLHDMGEALADGRPEFIANGQEWRTPPLWGLGLAQVVNPQAGFLHDGRARTLLEAVLWHGGEAQAARAAVIALSTAERDALLAFLGSL